MTLKLSYSNVMKYEKKRFSLDELSALVEMPKRRVRFYIQEGLVSRPFGDSPRAAYYTQDHLEQLLTIRKWQRAGLSLERIREILHEERKPSIPPKPHRAGDIEVWSHMVISDGVELHIEPERSGISPEQVRELFKQVMDAYKYIKNKGEE